MAKEKLPPACAFAISVLAEYDADPDAVPEEALEAAQQHVTTCVRCLSNTSIDTTLVKKKKVHQVAESGHSLRTEALREAEPAPTVQAAQQAVQTPQQVVQASPRNLIS